MTTITVQDLKDKMAQNETLNLIDVRELHERQEFNIGGLHIPLGNIQTLQIDDIEHLKEEQVFLYCRSGNRSGIAAMVLETAGFKNVVNVVGGMLAWQG